MADLVVGISIPTGSTKGIRADSTGNVIHSEVVRHETSFPRPGWAEHDLDATWWAGVVAICRRLTTLAKGDVAGICISGIGPVFLAADERGQGFPATLYGVDTRSTNEIDELTERHGVDRVLEVCGNPMTFQPVCPKIESSAQDTSMSRPSPPTHSRSMTSSPASSSHSPVKASRLRSSPETRSTVLGGAAWLLMHLASRLYTQALPLKEESA